MLNAKGIMLKKIPVLFSDDVCLVSTASALILFNTVHINI